MKLLSNHILVEHVSHPIKTAGGILFPESMRDENHGIGPFEMLVIAVGPGKVNKKGVLIPIECQPGDRIVTNPYTLNGVKTMDDGKKIIRFEPEAILAVLPKTVYALKESHEEMPILHVRPV